MNRFKFDTRDALYLAILTICSFFILRATMYPGNIWQTHDLKFGLQRAAAATHAINEGQWFPRWSREFFFGYGYPVLLFNPPASTLFVAWLHLVTGTTILTGTKVLIFCAVFLSNLFSYLLGRLLWGKTGGYLVAIFYLFLPYHIITLLVRGAVAEFLALGIIPAVLWSFYRLNTEQPARIIIAGLSIAFLMLAHNATWLFVVPIVLLIIVTKSVSERTWKLNIHAVSAVFLGLGVSAFYWIPAFSEKSLVSMENLINAEHMNFRKHLVTLDQLFASDWGYAGLGYSLTAAFLIAVLVPFEDRNAVPSQTMFRTFYCLVPISIFLSSNYAAFIWEHLPILQYIAFPWRLSGVAGLCAALCIPVVFVKLEKESLLYPLLFVATALAIDNGYHLCNREIIPFDENHSLSSGVLIQSGAVAVAGNEYMPKLANAEKLLALGPRTQSAEILSGNGAIILEHDLSHLLTLQVIAESDLLLRFNCLWFEGWQAHLDSSPIQIEIEKNTGLMLVSVPKGVHSLAFEFTNTVARMTGNWISVVTSGFIGILGFLQLVHYRRKKV